MAGLEAMTPLQQEKMFKAYGLMWQFNQALKGARRAGVIFPISLAGHHPESAVVVTSGAYVEEGDDDGHH